MHGDGCTKKRGNSPSTIKTREDRHATTRIAEICGRDDFGRAFRTCRPGRYRTVKVGVVGAKTGPLAPGAAVTHFPPWRLWAHEVNQAGGLKLKDGQRKVELIEYDDRTQPPEAIKAVERLATIDKVDWIAGLYGTGFNVAAVPTFAKLGYPQIPVACVTELGPQLVKKYPLLFFGNGTLTHYARPIDVLKNFRDAGQIGNKVAMVNVADEYGIEISNISKTHSRRPASKSSTTNHIRSARKTMRR